MYSSYQRSIQSRYVLPYICIVSCLWENTDFSCPSLTFRFYTFHPVTHLWWGILVIFVEYRNYYTIPFFIVNKNVSLNLPNYLCLIGQFQQNILRIIPKAVSKNIHPANVFCILLISNTNGNIRGICNMILIKGSIAYFEIIQISSCGV